MRLHRLQAGNPPHYAPHRSAVPSNKHTGCCLRRSCLPRELLEADGIVRRLQALHHRNGIREDTARYRGERFRERKKATSSEPGKVEVKTTRTESFRMATRRSDSGR